MTRALMPIPTPRSCDPIWVGDVPSLRQLEGKLWEVRVGRHRVAYVIVSGLVMILLHPFKKQGARTPRSDLTLALKRAKEVLGGKP